MIQGQHPKTWSYTIHFKLNVFKRSVHVEGDCAQHETPLTSKRWELRLSGDKNRLLTTSLCQWCHPKRCRWKLQRWLISWALAHMAAACLFVPQAAPQGCKSSSVLQVSPENDAEVFSYPRNIIPKSDVSDFENSRMWHASTIHQVSVLKECQTLEQLTSKSRQLCLSHCLSLKSIYILSSSQHSNNICSFRSVHLRICRHTCFLYANTDFVCSSESDRPRTGPVWPRSWVVIPWRVKDMMASCLNQTPTPIDLLTVWALALTSCISVQAGYDQKTMTNSICKTVSYLPLIHQNLLIDNEFHTDCVDPIWFHTPIHLWCSLRRSLSHSFALVPAPRPPRPAPPRVA